MKLLDHMLKQFVERGWVEWDEQRTDATHVLAADKKAQSIGGGGGNDEGGLVSGRKSWPFKKQYRRRAGVEGSISQGVRSFHLRSCRYIGLAKTHLQHILIAAAMNMTRIVCRLRGDRHARTRITPFSALALNFT